MLTPYGGCRFYLPMLGMAQSLNISVAVAVTLAQTSIYLPNKAQLNDDEKQDILANWLIRDVRASRQILLKEGIEIEGL